MTLIKFFLIVCTMILICILFPYRAVGAQPAELNVTNTSQSEVNQKFCGPYSLLIICQMLDVRADLEEISRLAGTTEKGTVVSEIPVIPKMIELGNINGKEKIIRKLEVYDWGLQQLKVKKVSTSSTQIAARLISQKYGEKAVIQVEIYPEIPQGEIKEKVIIYTNHPKTSEISVQIRGIVTGPIQVFPSQFSLGFIQRGQPSSQSVTITQHGLPNLEITQVEIKAKEMTVEIIPIKSGHEYLVKLSFVAGKDTPKTVHDMIRIHTNQPEQSLIEVPVYGIVQ